MSWSFATKKLMLSSALFLATTSLVFADYKDEVTPCPAVPSLRDGFYIGLQGGYDSYRVKVVDDSGEDTFNSTPNATGWVGGIFVGYGRNFNPFYLGGEAFLNGSSVSVTDSFNDAATGVSGSRKFSAHENFGIAILPGIKFTDATLSYIRFGYNWAKVKTNQILTGIPDGYNISSSRTVGGFVYGVGIETLLPIICDNVSVRAEYTYTNYGTFRPSSSDIKFSPADNRFMLGIIYHV